MTVQELWDRTWGAVNTLEKANIDFLTAVNEATEHIFTYLWKRKSEVVTDLFALSYFEPLEDSSQNFLLDGDDAPLLAVRTLPSDFRGLAERPFVNGELDPLEPVTEELRRTLVQQTGSPTHYELKATKLYLWPLPEETTIIRGAYFKHPGTLTAYTEDIPMNGIFDLAYRAIVLAIVELGVSTDLTPLLDKHVGEVLEVRDSHAPPRTVVKDF